MLWVNVPRVGVGSGGEAMMFTRQARGRATTIGGGGDNNTTMLGMLVRAKMPVR